MAKNYKVLQRATVSEQFLFAWKIFASWDHAITDKEMAIAKARQITVALKVGYRYEGYVPPDYFHPNRPQFYNRRQ